jgi:EAL domain-containing protein (putative c-di-GMP-specific phosphodiesterase class I)
MLNEVIERRALQKSLRDAIPANQFVVTYQPQVELKTGRIFAVEALLRWDHPELGIILPEKFIGLAEESGLIVPLGNWVLREACRQNKAWQEACMAPITMCVNVSTHQLAERNWASDVAEILRETGMDPKYLELELTESALRHDIKQAVATIKKLQTLGVHFTIDKFGTGYSSFSSLKDLPVTRLKIDKSLIKTLPSDSISGQITKAIIAFGLKLNMNVIADGVETAEQLAFLQNSKCREIQGLYFSEPVGSEFIAGMLSKHSEPDASIEQAFQNASQSV